MFTRSILIPSLVVCAIAAPILFSQAKQGPAPVDSQNSFALQTGYNSQGSAWLPSAQMNGGFGTPVQQTNSANYQNAPNGDPVFYQANVAGNPATIPAAANQRPSIYPIYPPQNTGSGLPLQSGWDSAANLNLPGSTTLPGAQFVATAPDFGASQTLIYPGNAYGPDFSASPLEFMPVSNLEEIFRFDISSDWVTRRWQRVSTSPGDDGLHGLRVALVTGTNSWDLHGSLTYFFDVNQQPQRITFRGWAGDVAVLTKLLAQRYDFKSQPTHWAGFYLAKKRRKATGGILIQHPTVIYRDNPRQQVAVVMEINNPTGKFKLSDNFQSLIDGMQSAR